jgi:hypothetical protein
MGAMTEFDGGPPGGPVPPPSLGEAWVVDQRGWIMKAVVLALIAEGPIMLIAVALGLAVQDAIAIVSVCAAPLAAIAALIGRFYFPGAPEPVPGG